MFPVHFHLSLGIITNLLITSRALPISTTPLTPLPRRYLDPAFDKDLFKDVYSLDYQDVPKRTIAQQAHENAKKFPRNAWAQPSPPPGDNKGSYVPNAFKDQDLRVMTETNMIPQDFGDPYKKNYYNNYDYEAVYPEEAPSITEEAETNYVDSLYARESPTSVSNYGSIDSPNINYPAYPMGDINSFDYDVDLLINKNVETESSSDEYIEGNENEEVDAFIPMATPTIAQQTLAASIKAAQKMQQTQQVKQIPPNDVKSESNENEKSKVKEGKSTTMKQTTKPSPSEQKVLKDIKDEPVYVKEDTKPKEREIFSRTTTITKTTTWYVNSDNEITVVEEDDEKPQPLKFQYLKTSKTTTSGPIPWYLQDFEDVIFEEENEKTKTILDKMSHLKGLNPTAINSFTIAPNPWSTEVHEEVHFEETVAKKEPLDDIDLKSHHIGPHTSPLEHVVDFLPRTQVVYDDIEVPAKEEVHEESNHQTLYGKNQDSKVAEIPHETYQEHPPQHMLETVHPPAIEYPILSAMDFSSPPTLESNNPIVLELPIPQTTDFVYYPVNGPLPKSHPSSAFEEEHFVPEFLHEHNRQENVYMNDLHNSLTPTQPTTPKPMTTLSPVENNFTPQPPLGTHQITESTHPSQQNFNQAQALPSQHPALYGNPSQQQTNWEHPGGGSAREKWDSWNEHQQTPNREIHPWSNELGRTNVEHPWPNIDLPKPTDLPRPTIDLQRSTVDHQWQNHEHQRPMVELQWPNGDHLNPLHTMKMDVAHKDKMVQEDPGRHHWAEQDTKIKMGPGPISHMFQNRQQFPNRSSRPRDL